jgi:hypothetical protein
MCEGSVRQWGKMFKDGRTNAHDEEQSGRPTVLSDDLVQSVDQRTVINATSHFKFCVNFHC